MELLSGCEPFCTCFRVTYPLLSCDDLYSLDHLSIEALSHSCYLWALESGIPRPKLQVSRVGDEVIAKFQPRDPIDPDFICPRDDELSQLEFYGTKQRLIALLPDGRRTVELPDDLNEFAWPVPLTSDSQQVMLVLRQVVQEHPSTSLGKKLSLLPAWEHAQELCLKRIAEASESKWDEVDQLDAFWILTELGLPATPATADYLLHTVDSKRFPEGSSGASRGAQVTSICLSPDTEHPAGHGGVLTCISGSHPWVPSDLMHQAVDVAEKHANWWQAVKISGMLNFHCRNGRGIGDRGELVLKCLGGQLDFDELITQVAGLDNIDICNPNAKAALRKRLRSLLQYYRKKQTESLN